MNALSSSVNRRSAVASTSASGPVKCKGDSAGTGESLGSDGGCCCAPLLGLRSGEDAADEATDGGGRRGRADEEEDDAAAAVDGAPNTEAMKPLDAGRGRDEAEAALAGRSAPSLRSEPEPEPDRGALRWPSRAARCSRMLLRSL